MLGGAELPARAFIKACESLAEATIPRSFRKEPRYLLFLRVFDIDHAREHGGWDIVTFELRLPKMKKAPELHPRTDPSRAPPRCPSPTKTDNATEK